MLKRGEVVQGSGGLRWKIDHMRGKGTCAEVYQAHVVGETEARVAIKIYKEGDSIAAAHDREGILLELVAKAHGPCKQLVKTLDDFDIHNKPCFTQELLEFDLHQLSQKVPTHGLSLYVIQRLAKDVFMGLNRIHQTGFVHGDIKPCNLLWSSQDDCLKIIDFSISFHVEDKNIGELHSQGYRAPEVERWNNWVRLQSRTAAGRNSITLANPMTLSEALGLADKNIDISIAAAKPQRPCDMWGVACILMAMFSGTKLFTSDRIQELHTLYQQNKLEYTDCVKGAESVLSILMDKLVKQREQDTQENISEALRLFRDLIERLLSIHPNARITSNDAVKHSFFMIDLVPSHIDLLILQSRILRFTNVVSDEDMKDPRVCNEIKGDVIKECERFGAVEASALPTSGLGAGKLFVMFSQGIHAMNANQALCRRTFNGHGVVITYYPVENFLHGEFC